MGEHADHIIDQDNTTEEIVDMDEIVNQEFDLDENPIDLTKDNPSTTQFPDNDSSR